MDTTIKEDIKRELWFWYFTDYLYRTGTITAEKKAELEKRLVQK